MMLFGGGVSYTELRDMPMSELTELHKQAQRIGEAMKAQASKSKRK